MEVDRVYVTYTEDPDLRRDTHVITVQEHHRPPVSDPGQTQQAPHQRFSPHEPLVQQHQQARYQTSPNGTPAESYETAGAMVSQANAGMHLSSPGQNYSPPLDVIRPDHQQHQQLVATAYADGTATIKYSTEVSTAAENLKASSTYTTLETVPLPPSQAVPYTQYIATSEFQQAPTSYSYPKHQEIFIYSASSQAPRGGEVSNI